MRMKRLVFSIFCFAFSLTLSALTPIRQFEPSRYSGEGEWLKQDGTTGYYKDIALFNQNGLTTINFSLDKLYIFDTYLKIDENGFVYLLLVDVSNPDNIRKFEGSGHCGSFYCSLNVKIEKGVLHKNIMFNSDGTLSYFGDISYEDGSSIQWEGHSTRLP